MKIAIPSYKRSRLIKERTLAYLSKCGVPESSIYIFVSNADEKKDYAYLEAESYNVVYQKDLNNLMGKHNAILDYFEKGERIIVIEDDIKKLVRKNGNKVIPYYDFFKMVEDGWHQCDVHQTKLWGIYPMANGMYMSDDVANDLKCVAGYLFGLEITKDKFLRCNTQNKHDYERSILHYIKYGAVIRLNYIAQVSDSFATAGGLQAQHTNEERCESEIAGNNYLLKRFPHLIKAHHRMNKMFSKPTEMRMNFTVNRNGKADLYALQKLHDKQINFLYE
jgi:hypothetical protein